MLALALAEPELLLLGQTQTSVKSQGHYYIQIVCQHCNNIFNVPVYCGDRFCTICGLPRRLKIRDRLNFLTENVELGPSEMINFMTLTIRSDKNPERMLNVLLKSFRKLRQTPYWKKRVTGGAFVIEVTRNVHGWHFHIHACVQSIYLHFEDLLKHWIASSPGRGVFVKPIPPAAITRYLTKYLAKCEAPEGDLAEINAALKGRRLYQPFGSWHAINLKYPKPVSMCRSCHSHSLIPLSLCFGDYPEKIWIETG